jgi:hypothetical protein
LEKQDGGDRAIPASFVSLFLFYSQREKEEICLRNTRKNPQIGKSESRINMEIRNNQPFKLPSALADGLENYLNYRALANSFG